MKMRHRLYVDREQGGMGGANLQNKDVANKYSETFKLNHSLQSLFMYLLPICIIRTLKKINSSD